MVVRASAYGQRFESHQRQTLFIIYYHFISRLLYSNGNVYLHNMLFSCNIHLAGSSTHPDHNFNCAPTRI